MAMPQIPRINADSNAFKKSEQICAIRLEINGSLIMMINLFLQHDLNHGTARVSALHFDKTSVLGIINPDCGILLK